MNRNEATEIADHLLERMRGGPVEDVSPDRSRDILADFIQQDHGLRAVQSVFSTDIANQQMELVQADLRDLLNALELGDHARAQSPHEVFQECVTEVRSVMKFVVDLHKEIDLLTTSFSTALDRWAWHGTKCDASVGRCECGLTALRELLGRVKSPLKRSLEAHSKAKEP